MDHRLRGKKKENFAVYEAVIKKGREEYKRGDVVSWEEVKKKADRLKKTSKPKKAA